MESKTEIRARLLLQRRALPTEAVTRRSKAIHQHLFGLEVFRAAQSVFSYVSSKDGEVDTLAVIERLLGSGREVHCPGAGMQRTLEWRKISKIDDLVPGRFSILEPHSACLVSDTSKGEVVLVPGIAFSARGERIGYGGGYFDRFLTSFRGVSIGLAFDMQMVESIPVEPHDTPVQMLVTESGVYHCQP
ncbi:MAG TPA: 5-formyltetrahydrofolate cyclo-ligase [Candidatus Hydrogenedentes bacterium]|nr:5-formyltetrahydrofolate cyclo-ligase [Candidatus Hydrogenedentota bacterium]